MCVSQPIFFSLNYLESVIRSSCEFFLRNNTRTNVIHCCVIKSEINDENTDQAIRQLIKILRVVLILIKVKCLLHLALACTNTHVLRACQALVSRARRSLVLRARRALCLSRSALASH